MALIHQNLCAQDYLTNINVKNHIVEWYDSIIQTYSYVGLIKPYTEVDEIPIDADNFFSSWGNNELINNALKHAFQEGDEGHLWIRLEEMKDTNFIRNKGRCCWFWRRLIKAT